MEPVDISTDTIPARSLGLLTGIVIRRYPAACDVLASGQMYRCALAGSLSRPAPRAPRRFSDASGTSLAIVVGDEVRIEPQGCDTGVVRALEPRRNALGRRADRHGHVQVVAANVDQIVAVFAAAQPAPKWRMLDRYLVIAESEGIPALICVTKIDLVDAGALARELRHYAAAGYPLEFISARTGAGLELLRNRLAGRTSVMVGKSGVGKTSLLNALAAGPERRTGEISARTGKGRHVTSVAERVPLPGGGAVIDTPGVRELGLCDLDARELAACFPELRPLLGQCRFADGCTHSHEKGCAVRAAAESGAIDPRRYNSYLRLLSDLPQHGVAAARPERTPVAPDAFRCAHCGWQVAAVALGTWHRNHCPRCLWSLHLDVQPGDRAAGCGGPMSPIAVWVRQQGEWAIVHRCERCGAIRANRVAGDDDELTLMSLAVRALASPPFPLDRLASAAQQM